MKTLLTVYGVCYEHIRTDVQNKCIMFEAIAESFLKTKYAMEGKAFQYNYHDLDFQCYYLIHFHMNFNINIIIISNIR